MLTDSQRILVVGSPGSGKSTFARRLGALLGLPVVHLDHEYWQPGWQATPRDEWDARLGAILAEPRWIIEGMYARTLERRLATADAVVFLDVSRWLCRARALRRALRERGRTRADLGPDCPEHFDVRFQRYVWNWPRDVRPGVLETLQRTGGCEVLTLSSRQEIAGFLEALASGRSTTW